MSTKTGRGSAANADFLSGGNRAYLEDLHNRYLNNPDSVNPGWQQVFHDLANEPTANSAATATDLHAMDQAEYGRKQAAVLRLINAYRTRGHSIANTDPLGLARPEVPEDFDLKAQGLEKADLSTSFDTGSLAFGPAQMPLNRILELCDATYCGPLGIEYMYITDTAQKRWLQERLECEPVRASTNADFRRHLLQRLTAAEGLERYLHTRYVGQKRFSLEGGEALVPMLGDLIQRAGGVGIKEIVVGMAHRGRLNVLVNILGKSPEELFGEFEGKTTSSASQMNTGDVKYHQGFSADIETPGGVLHMALAFNPSHLEIINPVVEGSVRARQDRRKDDEKNTVLPVLIHGDAAFAGQGVVMESLNMSNTRGFSTGGTIHIVINNQIGFTTRNPLDARSTPYCTDDRTAN